jgi:hypothetical protein
MWHRVTFAELNGKLSISNTVSQIHNVKIMEGKMLMLMLKYEVNKRIPFQPFTMIVGNTKKKTLTTMSPSYEPRCVHVSPADSMERVDGGCGVSPKVQTALICFKFLFAGSSLHPMFLSPQLLVLPRPDPPPPFQSSLVLLLLSSFHLPPSSAHRRRHHPPPIPAWSTGAFDSGGALSWTWTGKGPGGTGDAPSLIEAIPLNRMGSLLTRTGVLPWLQSKIVDPVMQVIRR